MFNTIIYQIESLNQFSFFPGLHSQKEKRFNIFCIPLLKSRFNTILSRKLAGSYDF